MNSNTKKTTTVDMTVGSISKLLIAYAIPLLLGNLFQLLYNTVDVLVVGNFVGTQALAAVGSTTPIINILVSFFNGFSVGAGVVISRYYGAHNEKQMHTAIETTMACTFVFGVLFTIIGVSGVPFMLRLMSTPDDVVASATTYLRIYFSGIAGLLVYNMGSGILRAVGDTRRPLMFLCFTSVLNIFLDLLFVLAFRLGIAGVAYATILSQFLSAILILILLSRTSDMYRLVWRELAIDLHILQQITSIALPTAIQSTVTCFSNVIVQSYINSFGSSCMAGWSTYIKVDQYMFLPIQSMGQAVTTFVSQNIGARNVERAKQGTIQAFRMILSLSVVVSLIIWIGAAPITRAFSNDAEVLAYSRLFVRMNILFLNLGCIHQILAGALRGTGDARAPMIIMISSFVVFRQIYLYVGSRILHDIHVIGFGYPIGWILCSILMVSYYRFSHWEEKALGQTE